VIRAVIGAGLTASAVIGGAIAVAGRPRDRDHHRGGTEGVLVELPGTIEPGDTIEAPLSGRTCVHYELEISDATQSGGPVALLVRGPMGGRSRRGKIARRAREVRSIPFAIADDTGRALIAHAARGLTCSSAASR
jgi:hypothetical protein